MAVTVTKTRQNINGAFREKYYVLSVGITGDTYVTPFKQIIELSISNSSVTSMTAVGGTITFTGTAPAGTLLKVTGW